MSRVVPVYLKGRQNIDFAMLNNTHCWRIWTLGLLEVVCTLLALPLTGKVSSQFKGFIIAALCLYANIQNIIQEKNNLITWQKKKEKKKSQMNSILYCLKSPIFLSLVKSNDKFSKASVTILDDIVEPFCLPPPPIHLFLWLHTERVSSMGWKNSNAFIKTIIEHETQSKEGILYTALQSSSVPLCPRNVCETVCVCAHM